MPSKRRKGHNGPKRPERPYPTVAGVEVPYAVMTHSHGAMARLDAMEEASRRAIAAGNPNFRIVKPKTVRKPPLLTPADMSGLILGVDGKPIGV